MWGKYLLACSANPRLGNCVISENNYIIVLRMHFNSQKLGNKNELLVELRTMPSIYHNMHPFPHFLNQPGS